MTKPKPKKKKHNKEELEEIDEEELKSKFNKIITEGRFKSKNLKVQNIVKEFQDRNAKRRDFDQKTPIIRK